MQCYLLDRDRHRFEQRAQRSAVSEAPRAGYFRLFNKNGWRTTFVRPITQRENCAEWVVEVTEPLDPYFRHVLRPINVEEDGTTLT